MLTVPMIVSKYCVIIVLLVKKKRNVYDFQVFLFCDIRTETVFFLGRCGESLQSLWAVD